MVPPLGVVEGFYGRPYSWPERRALVEFLASEGYDHYFYAPKADGCLRARWSTEHAPAELAALRSFGDHCRRSGLAWGIGLSPPSGGEGDLADLERRLLSRVEQLSTLSIDRLALLFDDVRGHPRLAPNQCVLANSVRRNFPELRLALCPTYYCTSAVLDRVFGERPAQYLAQLGAELAPEVDVFWTGPEVCSREYDAEHLARVSAELCRRPWIWDNYPVNDGPRMYRFLRLRGFPPRTRALSAQIAGISVNPMNQAWLSRIPLASLPSALARDTPSDPEAAFHECALRLLPAPLFEQLERDLERFHDRGLDALTDDEAAELIRLYQRFDHPGAREVVSWLSRETAVGDECLTG